MFADKKQHDNRMRKFRNRKIVMLQLWLGFHLQWLTKSKHSCQNLERRQEKLRALDQEQKVCQEKEDDIITLNRAWRRGRATCVMAAMYTAIPEEDSQSSTAEVLFLRCNSFGRGDRFYQFEIHSLYVTLGTVCGNGLTYPSMPKR